MNAPRWTLFVISLVLGLTGIAAKLGYVSWLAPLSFGLLACGFLLLVLGVLIPRR
jgi:predicted membrane channel-forming protein YqfA (hemolysin III family)